MKHPRIAAALAGVALLTTTAACGSGGGASSAPPAPGSGQPSSAGSSAAAAGYDPAHAGGTLHLTANAAGGTLDPQINYTLQYWQLYQAAYDGLLAFQKTAGNGSFTVVPDLAAAMPAVTDGGKTYTFTAPQGHQVLQRPATHHQGRRRVVRADLQGLKPDRGHVLQRHRRGRRLPREAGDLRPVQGSRRGPGDGQGRDPPDRARPGVPLQALGAARVDPARLDPGQGPGHHAHPGDRRLLLRLLRPQPAAHDEAQPVLQAVVGRRRTAGLPRRDHPDVRPHGRGRGDRGGERAGRLGVRPAARRPAR